ncbi:MAG: crossover junction endodeoxyribonuclease RuvC, partial [Anaerolineales bacterium]|nr:crossover junction endodeoxyribonuclease RuvC [Anaerolineales bacterium]
ELVTYGVILTPKTLPMGERLIQIHTQLADLIREHQPATAAVEKLFFQKNVSTAMTVGQARGVIMLALAEARVPIGEYTPNEIKQAVAGYGSADKPQMQQMVRTLLNLREIPRPDDAADALAVAICHLHSYKFKSL